MEGLSPNFSFGDFENWMSSQEGLGKFFGIKKEDKPQATSFIGCEVSPKVGKKKLLEKIEADEDDVLYLIEDFIENGGTIADIHERKLFIETEAGEFFLPRFCVKVKCPRP